MTEQMIQLQAIPSDEGFNILAISAGEAKGHDLKFSAAVLQASLPLWDGKPVNIDHPGMFESPSLRNLAGTVHNPQWNDTEQGIQMTLKPSGPASDVLLQIRNAAIENPAIMQAVGFSAWVILKLDKDRNVSEIKDVRFVDAVIDPARGGKFLQSLPEITGESAVIHAPDSASNPHLLKGERMTQPNPSPLGALEETNESALDPRLQQIEANRRAAAEILGEQERMAALEAQQRESEAILIAQCAHLLDSGLSASRLPERTQARLRRQFEGRAFKPADLTTAIQEAKEEIAALGSGHIISGPGRTGQMFNSEDQIRAAMDDLLGAERDADKAGLKVARFSGIRDAYLMLTGDANFTGNIDLDIAMLATTANFPGIVKDSMNKVLVQAWRMYGEAGYDWWKKITTIEHFTSLNEVDWLITGTIASLPTVAERGEYTALPMGDNVETSSWTKYGGYVPITLESILRDDTRAFRAFPREVALGGIRNVSEQVAAIFTSNSGAGPTLADGGALFNATAVTTAGGHANLLTTALGTDYTAWEAVASAMYNQPMHVANTYEGESHAGTGKKQAIDPKYCLVPRALRGAANDLFVKRQTYEALPADWFGMTEPLTVPEWTDTTDWAATADPRILPGVMIGEIFGVMPQLFIAGNEKDPAMFSNDESRIKVRQFLTVGVSNFRALHKSNVAG